MIDDFKKKKFVIDGQSMDWTEVEKWADNFLKNPPPSDPNTKTFTLSEYAARLMKKVHSPEFEEALKRESLELYLKAKAIQAGQNSDEVSISDGLLQSDSRTPDMNM
ncbi:MAG: hypothetical protein LRY36_00610 [Alphaproteobacteria bacterium]|nr:hypothetical protein [Alphaproteobacteria bacterium]